MGKLISLFTQLHKKTARNYIARMTDDKVACMKIAKQYGRDYWDGDRRYGYGGYRYDGRWKVIAEALIQRYSLKKDAKILDVGCGKAFLLYELQQLLPESEITGFDISQHGINDAKDEIKKKLFIHRAEDPYPFGDKQFDLVISFTTLHNLRIYGVVSALKEIERVAKNKFILVESYRSEQELFNLECWALTIESLFAPDEWIWLFNHAGYTGDYEFIYFE
ncbi:MAG TPA: class I SAM-dependent methyltransferase [Candidatus Nanoarchaeia archaeon]|nr:class I SAM-dependent methyltransferase [Candidatus Nanoarchaeia archaeon]